MLIGVTSYSNLYTGHYITTIRPKSDLFVHPNFVPQSEKNFNDHDYLDTKTDSYDIALIKLHDKVKDIPTLSFFGSTVDINKTYMNTVVTIVGLGSTTGKDGTSPVSRLMKANIPIASYLFAPVKSNLIYLNSNNHNPFNSFVGQSVCTGDSGGPAILINNGKSYVVGVTMGGNCELKDSFYTSVSSLATWITTMTGIQPNSGTAMAPAITPYPTTFPLCASNQLNTEKECNRYLPNGICEWDGSTKTCGFVGKPHIVIPSKTFSQ